jgi:20S proteasome subunit alpha 6
MSGNRGGVSGGRGGRESFVGRGGSGGGGSSSGPLRGHGSRNNFGGGNNRRGGGSFTGSGGAGYSHQGGSFRGRNQGHMSSNRGNRLDGGSGSAFGSREGTMSSSFGGKKDENRRTLTDFKIVGLAIPDLSWTWGVIPSLSPVKAEGIAIDVDGQEASITVVKEMLDNSSIHAASSSIAKETQTEVKTEVPVQSTETEMADAKPLQDTMSNAHASSYTTSPPSRIRIYFHTPVTADDSRPIPGEKIYVLRKGKRKKLEDDDGDVEERQAPPPPPQMGGTINDDQLSVTASVAETASEGDWLMAAIVEGEEGGGATGGLPSEDDEDSDQLHVSEIIKDHGDDDSIDDNVTVGDTETFVDGEHCHNASRYCTLV